MKYKNLFIVLIFLFLPLSNVAAETYTGFTDQYVTCTLPIDFVVADFCVGSSLGIWIVLIVVFGVIGAIFRK